MQGLQHRLPGRHGAQTDDPHEVRQEATDAAVLRQQLVEIGIVGRPGQAVDLGHGGFEGSFGHDRENRRPETAVGDSAVEYQGADLAQGERRGIKVAQAAQARFPAFADRIDEHPGDQQVEQVEHVILCARFQRPDERQQGGEATFIRQPGDRLGLGGAGKARQGQDPGLRQEVGARQTGCNLPHVVQPLDRACQFSRALQGRPRPKPVHRALPSALRHHQKGIEPFFLVGRDPGYQQVPQAAVGTDTDPGNGPFEHARPRQQHLVRHQPGRCLVKQDARPVGSGPAQRIEPAQKLPTPGSIGKRPIAIAFPNFHGMVAAPLADCIATKVPGARNAKLSCQYPDNADWRFGWIVEKSAEESHRAEL